MLIIITMLGITSAKQKAKKEIVPFLNVYFSLFSTFNLLFSAIEGYGALSIIKWVSERDGNPIPLLYFMDSTVKPK